MPRKRPKMAQALLFRKALIESVTHEIGKEIRKFRLVNSLDKFVLFPLPLGLLVVGATLLTFVGDLGYWFLLSAVATSFVSWGSRKLVEGVVDKYNSLHGVLTELQELSDQDTLKAIAEVAKNEEVKN